MSVNNSYNFYPGYNLFNNLFSKFKAPNNEIYKSYKPLYLDLNKALSMSSYPKSNQDLIRNLIINDFKNDKNAKIYFSSNSYEKLIIIEYALLILLFQRNFKVILYIHLPASIPKYPPEFFIKKTKKSKINKVYLDGKINPQTFQININKFYFFDPLNINIKKILNRIKSKFEENFPIYKDSNMIDNSTVENFGKNNLNLNQLNIINI